MKRFVYFFLALGFLSSCNDETDVLPSTDQQSTAVTTDFSTIAEANLQNKTNQEAYLSQQLAALNVSESEIEKVTEYRSGFLNLGEQIKQLNLIGNSFFAESNYNFALLYYLSSLQLAVANDDIEKAATLYRNIALAYQYKEDYENAAINFWHSFQLWDTIGDESRIGQLYNDLGVVYALAHDFLPAEDFDVEHSFALAFFEAALDNQIALNTSTGTPQAEYNITVLYGVWSDKGLGANQKDEYLYAQDDVDDDL